MWAMGLLVLVTSALTFGVIDYQILNNTLAPIANWVFIGGFIGIYLLSDREIGNLESHEAIALLIPLVAAISIKMFENLDALLQDYNPAGGFVLLGATIAGFYVLATNMELKYVIVEIGLGSILAVFASVHYGIANFSVLDYSVSNLNVGVFIVTLVGAYMISKRSLGTFSENEVIALFVGIGSYFAYTYVGEISNLIGTYQPVSGIALTALVGVAYYVLMRNGNIIP